MLEIIRNIFGTSVWEENIQLPPGTPNYIRYGYSFTKLVWKERECLLVKPLDSHISLATLKKQTKNMEQLFHIPVVIELERLTSLQRTNLIESEIAFISGSGQVFIPTWGSYFEEKIRNPVEVRNVLSAGAQLVFLYLYYHGDGSGMRNQTQIAHELGMSKASFTRAVQQLEGFGLLSIYPGGTAKKVCLRNDENILRTAFPYMISPVQKQLYCRELPLNLPYKISGLKALAEQSMLDSRDSDSGYAISKAGAKQLKKDLLVDEHTFRDFGGKVIEVWEYDPFLLSDSRYVDDISLLLELNDVEDERVQKEMDGIRAKYKVEGEV